VVNGFKKSVSKLLSVIHHSRVDRMALSFNVPVAGLAFQAHKNRVPEGAICGHVDLVLHD